MTKFIQFLTLASALVFVSSCGKKDDDPDPVPTAQVGKVRFMNACISSTPLKVSINNTAIASITGLSYLQSTGYLDVAPGKGVNTSFVFQGSNAELAATAQDYNVNTFYSVFATGIVNDPSIFVTTDDMSVPSANIAKVRFINLSPGNLNEDVYIGDKKVDSNVVYKEATAFTTVDAGAHKIIVQDPKDVPSGLNSQQTFLAGKIYTIILTGLKNGTGDAQLKLTTVNNN